MLYWNNSKQSDLCNLLHNSPSKWVLQAVAVQALAGSIVAVTPYRIECWVFR